MKKVFVEPEMHRIELNLQENIATSITTSDFVSFYSQAYVCTVVTTNKYYDDPTLTFMEVVTKGCTSYSNTYSFRGGQNGVDKVPLEEFRRYFGR